MKFSAAKAFCSICVLASFSFWLSAGPPNPGSVLLCGKEKVFEATVQKSPDGKLVLHNEWVWSATESKGLPNDMAHLFRSTDDCKPVSGGHEILISSSSGAIALVSRENGDTLFYARVPGAHSAELIPGGLIAAAASTAPSGGERILLFNRRMSDESISSFPLKSAHGVQWDRKRNVLWVLGFDELLRVAITPDRKMRIMERNHLPEKGGHDLQITHDGSRLLLTNLTQVLEFNPETKSFTDFAPLAGKHNIKSLSINGRTKQLAYTQADSGQWWTYTLRFHNPAATISVPEYIYKVRWYQPHP